MAGFKLLRADGTNDEAGHLIDVVRLQVVTRGQAKTAAQDENPLSTETAPGSSLLDLIFKSQGIDPLCIRLKKELRLGPNKGARPGQGQESSNQKTTDYEGLRRQPDGDQEGSRRLNAGDEGASLKGYTLDQRGLLYYRGRVVIPQQKALIQELLYLYHDDQFAGH
jgi:hypothetical protein